MLPTAYGVEHPGHMTPAEVMTGIYIITKVSGAKNMAAWIRTSADPTGENTADPSHFRHLTMN